MKDIISSAIAALSSVASDPFAEVLANSEKRFFKKSGETYHAPDPDEVLAGIAGKQFPDFNDPAIRLRLTGRQAIALCRLSSAVSSAPALDIQAIEKELRCLVNTLTRAKVDTKIIEGVIKDRVQEYTV